MSDPETFRALVARLPYPQAEAARRLGLPRSTLNRWLWNKQIPTHPRMLELALRWLVTEEEERG